MSDQNPYEQLGVTEEASFEEIQEAKQRLIQQYSNDGKILESIEAAYDAVIMDRLRMRQEGKIKVPDRIRFPERLAPPVIESPPISPLKSPNWLQRSIDTPSAKDIWLPGLIYTALGGITVFATDPIGNLSSLLLAFGVFTNLYFVNRKERRFGRSLLLTFGGLIVGVALGAGLAALFGGSYLGFWKGHQITALVTFFVFWIVSAFLR
ncbi:CPP1-like family protein [Pannus brasiliensis CCIBt3594]|uniref:CPP1-like family protein n=1 Tax=Pannus brasiliensis CCIBt3594 TaxID=1427578 RepID=A0AAW9QR29_9CHRO